MTKSATKEEFDKLMERPSSEVRTEAKSVSARYKDCWAELAKLLYRIKIMRDYEKWKYVTFEAYVEEELGLEPRTVRFWLSIYDKLVLQLGVSEEKLKGKAWCFPPSQRIVCNPSTKEIKDVKVGDRILGGDGEWDTVKAILHMKESSLCRIDGSFFGPIEATGSHKFLVFKGGEKEWGRARKRAWRKGDKDSAKYFFKSPEYIPAENIQKGDFLLIPKLANTKMSGEFKCMSSDFFKFAGWYVAEGYADKNRLRISLGKNATSDIEEVYNCAKKVFPTMSVRLNRLHGGVGKNIVTISRGSEWRKKKGWKGIQKFKEWFGISPETKKVPMEFLYVSEDKLKEFIRSLWMGDGSVTGHKAIQVVSTVSRTLAEQVRLMLTRFDILASLYFSRSSVPNRQTLYHVSISSSDSDRFGIFDVFRKKNRSFTEYKRFPFGFAVSVRKVDKIPYEGEVIHLETNRGLFCCPVVCHNSKIRYIVPVANKQNIDKWLDKAERLSQPEIAVSVHDAIEGKPDKPDAELFTPISFRVSPDQRKTIEEALTMAKRMSPNKNEHDAHALDMICLNFLGDNLETTQDALVKVLAKVESVFRVKLLAIDKDNPAWQDIFEKAKAVIRGSQVEF